MNTKGLCNNHDNLHPATLTNLLIYVVLVGRWSDIREYSCATMHFE